MGSRDYGKEWTAGPGAQQLFATLSVSIMWEREMVECDAEFVKYGAICEELGLDDIRRTFRYLEGEMRNGF